MEDCYLTPNNRIVFIEVDDIERYPPEISILNALSSLSTINLIVCSLCPSDYMKKYCETKHIELINANGFVIRKKHYSLANTLTKVLDYKKCRERLWQAIDSVCQKQDILWINTFDALKLLGEKIINYKYIVHLYELIHETRVYYKLPYPKYNLGKYLRHAYRVIECEYNRACITQTWFQLQRRPVVIPNKLFLDSDKENYQVGQEIVEKMNKLKGKKIILYQGILGPERPIGVFAEAVSELGDDYTMLVMSNSKMDIKHKNLVEIDFINPPNHLYVTQRAYIGILNYQASMNGYSGNDSLNSIFCAPNKIYEYSRFGLPMIGNDIPGLKYTLEYSGAGICIRNMNKEDIKKAIIRIDNNYEEYKRYSAEFYNNVDIRKIILEDILSED